MCTTFRTPSGWLRASRRSCTCRITGRVTTWVAYSGAIQGPKCSSASARSSMHASRSPASRTMPPARRVQTPPGRGARLLRCEPLALPPAPARRRPHRPQPARRSGRLADWAPAGPHRAVRVLCCYKRCVSRSITCASRHQTPGGALRGGWRVGEACKQIKSFFACGEPCAGRAQAHERAQVSFPRRKSSGIISSNSEVAA